MTATVRYPEKALAIVRDYVLITLGGVCIALSVDMFLVPNNVVSSGLTGLGMIAHFLWGWKIGVVTFILNIPLLIAGVRYAGGMRFFIRTVYAVAVMTAAIDLLAPYVPPITGDPLIYTLFGGLLDGLGIGLVLRGKGTTAGTDIIAQLVNRFMGVSFGVVLLVVNTLILLAAAAVTGLMPVLYALIVAFVSSRVVDSVQEGVGFARAVFIITNELEAVRAAIFQHLDRGVTIIEARGGYTEQPRPMLFVSVTRGELMPLKQIIAEIDPEAFVVVTDAYEVLGKGFRPIAAGE